MTKKDHISALLAALCEQKQMGLKGGIYHKTQIDLTYNSNHIEGSRLTHEQTRYIFETNTIGMTEGPVNVNDIMETVNHFRCIDMVIDHATDDLSSDFIKELHGVLKIGTSDSRKDWFAVGDYKRLPNEVGGEETCAPEHVGEEMERLLAENDIPAECFSESVFKLSVSCDDKNLVSLAFLGSGTTTDQYAYIEGTPPENTDEIAISYITADKLNVKIGDTVTVKTGGENEEFIVTALFQSMNNMGEGIRLSEKLPMDFSKVLGYFSYQIKFTDNPSDTEQNERYDIIKKLYPDYKFRTAGEYLDYAISGVAGAMSGTKDFIILMVMIINILVVVLMEKSFLTKERGEIALMKAMGFKNHTLIAWQTIRIALLMAAAVIIAILLTDPLSQLAVGEIFRTMGAKYIVFDTNILDAYIIYPLAVFAVTVLASMISALGLRSISSQEVNNIE